MEIKSIQTVKNLKGKKIFLRSDLNVPLKNGSVADDFKIVSSLPTIRFLLRHKSRIIMATHLGEPSRKEKKLSTKPIAAKLEKMLGAKVKFINECVGEKVEKEAGDLKNGEIILLENLRFYKEEGGNDSGFAKKLAKLADIYVNDAFAVSHRSNASVDAIKKYLPSYAGILLRKEIESLNKILDPERPMALVMGGAKISSKLKLLLKLSKVSDFILLGGCLANSLVSAIGFETGKSIVEKERSLREKLRLFYEKNGSKKILLPIDFAVSGKKDGSGKITVKNMNNIGKNDYIYDIGPKTISFYASFVKKAKTIVWNGPLGFFENGHFKHGTLFIAHAIASKSGGSAFGVAGGGETVEALRMSKMADYVDWISTGGGAMLSYLGGEKMPGLKGLLK